MKSNGIVRRIDELGRIVIPKDIREQLGLEIKDLIELRADGDKIIMQKYEPCCVFCGKSGCEKNFNGKPICDDCYSELLKQHTAK